MQEAARKIQSGGRICDWHHEWLMLNELCVTLWRYRGLEKNTAQLYSLFGFANLLIVKKRLMALDGQIAS